MRLRSHDLPPSPPEEGYRVNNMHRHSNDSTPSNIGLNTDAFSDAQIVREPLLPSFAWMLNDPEDSGEDNEEYEDREGLDRPFLSGYDSSPSNRVWDQRNLPVQDFEIYEDPPDQPSRRPSTPQSLGNPDSDKENLLPSEGSRSDLSSNEDMAEALGQGRLPGEWTVFEIPYVEPLAERSLDSAGNLVRNTVPAPIFSHGDLRRLDDELSRRLAVHHPTEHDQAERGFPSQYDRM
ncbi:hypothetical protein N7468_001673 [Penicillium chermesinum]|uniref:Uncharacterized protein n=1 Tax=Penicillium chermesinum TaxID=63820 RepID=A0A9W9PH93_9EURO|nr:uncharacterized protein N7468_001673 [Penicillium chermesinum]KAJ5246690.1 hypothetical protein N7468_001673 [Penicillium chermesinum]KAJ6144960.1 hypothetical protein N7470_008855 [Penicillium chermesinum]